MRLFPADKGGLSPFYGFRIHKKNVAVLENECGFDFGCSDEISYALVSSIEFHLEHQPLHRVYRYRAHCTDRFTFFWRTLNLPVTLIQGAR